MVQRLPDGDREIIPDRTAHVSRESVRLVEEVIAGETRTRLRRAYAPSRYPGPRQKDRWRTWTSSRSSGKRKPFCSVQPALASFQKRHPPQKMDVIPARKCSKPSRMADALGAQVWLAGRDIRAPCPGLARAGWWSRITLRLPAAAVHGRGGGNHREEIERMKQQDVLEALLAEVGRSMPMLKTS